MKKFFINTIYINLFLTFLLSGIIAKILFYNCSCCNKSKENMTTLFSNNLSNTLLDYSNFTNNNNNNFFVSDNDIYNNLHYHQLNSNDLLNKNNLNYFNNNKFDARCCLKNYEYSTSNGCICLSQKQNEFLKFRGNNNTFL